MPKTRGVAAVDRAFTILDAFSGTDGTLTLAAIASRTSLYKSTILRLIESLEDFNYIRRLDDGRYQLGPKPFELGAIYQSTFSAGDFIMPTLRNMVERLNESASFYVREGQRRICLFRVDGRQTVRDHIRSGDALTLDKGAAGHILTGFDGGLSGSLKDRSVISRSYGERDPDVAAVAGAVFGIGGRLEGALTISGPRERFNGATNDRISEVVHDSALKLSVSLGAPKDRVEALFGRPAT